MTKAQRHMGRIAALGCIACRKLGLGETPAAVHHIREGRVARNDFLTLPLCPEHHTGTTQSVHLAKRRLMDALGIESEYDLLAETIEELSK